MNGEPPHAAGDPAADKALRQRLIFRSIWVTVPGTYAMLALAQSVLPALPGLQTPGERIVLAARWLLVALIPYAAVCVTILRLRYVEGSHNPLAGGESERLTIHCRVMQNTLEQLVWFALCIIPLATYLTPARARMIPVLCVFFAFARLVYWWGYLRSGTLGRAPGVQLTFALNIPLLVVVLALFVRDLFA